MKQEKKTKEVEGKKKWVTPKIVRELTISVYEDEGKMEENKKEEIYRRILSELTSSRVIEPPYEVMRISPFLRINVEAGISVEKMSEVLDTLAEIGFAINTMNYERCKELPYLNIVIS